MARPKNDRRGLSPTARLRLLMDAADRLGIRVRTEKLTVDDDLPRPRSGLVRLAGKPMIILDRGLSPEVRARTLAEALSGLDLNGVFLPPAVREMVEEQSGGQDEENPDLQSP